MMHAMSDQHPPPPAAMPPSRPGPLPAEPLPGRPRDPGTPKSRLIALVLVTLLYLFLALSQNLTPYLVEPENPLGREPRGGEFAKLFLLLEEAAGTGSAGSPLVQVTLQQFAASSHPADQLQGVLVLREFASDEAALDWLGAVRSDADLEPLARGASWQGDPLGEPDPHWATVLRPDGPVVDEEAVADAAAMETLLTGGPDAMSPDARDRLRDRYGWLGDLALAPEGAEREALFKNTPWAVAFIVFTALVFVTWGLGGLVMGVLAFVFLLTGKLGRGFVPPRPGGSVYLETFGVFLFGFGVVHFGGAALGKALPHHGQIVQLATLLGQWALLLTVFWPVLRGVRLTEWRPAVGWSAPRGVWREIGAGVAGYFAGVPLLVLGMIATVVLNFLSSHFFGPPDEPPTNPVLEMVQNADVLTLILFLSLATIWAPVVEETLFRGAIYRHMRGRMGILLAGVFSALLFAFMHSYGPLMTGPLIALGFTFAMIREWRGSLIGAVVAHCLHNSTVMFIMLLAMRAMA